MSRLRCGCVESRQLHTNKMKDKLTPEQSQRLIELGVDASKASKVHHVDPYGLDDAVATNQPIFDLSDVLSLLPKEIKHKGDPYGLDINWDDSWSASYFNAVNFVTPYKEGSIAFEQAPELIDALYELLVWCIANKYLKP